ncbi:MAG: DUF3048 domain-containing protein [Mycoplasmatota bacterium]
MKKLLKIFFVILILSLIGFSVYFYLNYEEEEKEIVELVPTKVDVPELQIIDVNSDSRNIAVMINNISTAVPYHSGLQQAHTVYEIITEGGITRLMAVFKDQDLSSVGSVRSSRHYFLDYALENDAIYVHYGFSEYAKSDIYSLGINNINGLYDNAFIRLDLPIAYEHTAYTNSDLINSYIESKGYDTTSDTVLLNYSVFNVNLSTINESIVANEVMINYSSYDNTSFVYDSENQVYNRFKNGVAHSDYVTGLQYTAKNIIVLKVENYSIDSYGRQDLYNIGTGSGYYITNGYAVEITWEKESRESQTIYKDLNGNEIFINDGNTYIQIQPIDQDLIIS